MLIFWYFCNKNTQTGICYILVNNVTLLGIVHQARPAALERSFGWLNHSRWLWKNREHTLHNSCRMMVLAFISI